MEFCFGPWVVVLEELFANLDRNLQLSAGGVIFNACNMSLIGNIYSSDARLCLGFGCKPWILILEVIFVILDRNVYLQEVESHQRLAISALWVHRSEFLSVGSIYITLYWLWNFVSGYGSLFWSWYLHFWGIVSHLGLTIHLLIAHIYVFECEIHIQDIILTPKFSYKSWILVLVEMYPHLSDVVSFDGTDLTFWW